MLRCSVEKGLLVSRKVFHGCGCFHHRAMVMFLVEDNQRNIFDQRYIENELWKM